MSTLNVPHKLGPLVLSALLLAPAVAAAQETISGRDYASRAQCRRVGGRPKESSRFAVILDAPVSVGGAVVIPTGTKIYGRIPPNTLMEFRIKEPVRLP